MSAARVRGMRRQRGLSMVELMISVTIGLALLAGLATVFSNTSSNQAELSRTSAQIENGRFASQLLQEDISHAGFYGRYVGYATAAQQAAGLALPDPCSTNIDTGTATPTPLQQTLIFPVIGYDASQPPTPATSMPCLAAANYKAGTDILIIRRADSKVTAPGALVNATIYLQSVAEPFSLTTLSAIVPVLAKGSTPTAFNLVGGPASVPGEIRRFRVHIYFVAPCSVPSSGTTCDANADSGNPIPTLKRLEINESGVFEIVPLVEGIEDFQVDYGIDAVPGGLTGSQPYAGDGMPDGYKKNPDVNEMTQVTSIRIHVLARGTEISPGHTDTKTYKLGLHGNFTPTGAAQKYKRHLFVTTVRLQNVAGWREQ